MFFCPSARYPYEIPSNNMNISKIANESESKSLKIKKKQAFFY